MSDVRLVMTAAAFAARMHSGQFRKGANADPYINHPIEVARLLAEVGGIEDVRILAAALLHDTLEDTEATFEELGAKFGEAVAGLVQEVTDDTSLPREDRNAHQIASAPKKSPGAALVKVTDQCANVYDILHNPPDGWDAGRKQAYIAKARSVIEAMAPVASGDWSAPGWEPEQLNAIRQLYAHFESVVKGGG